MTGALISLSPELPEADGEAWRDVARMLTLAARSAERADADSVAKHFVAAHVRLQKEAVKSATIAKLWAKLPYVESFLEDDLAAMLEGAAPQVRDLVAATLDIMAVVQTLESRRAATGADDGILVFLRPALSRLERLVASTSPSAWAALSGESQ